MAAERKAVVNALLTLGLAVDIGMLAYFKYANFFVDNVDALTGANWTLDRVILPLAISFYTFQKIAYLMDSARGEAKPMSPLDFTLFASFFPQLISGPIVHYKEIAPQLQGPLFGKLLWRSCIPSFSRDADRLGEGSVLAQEFFVSLDERPQPFLGHVGDEIVEQAALPEQILCGDGRFESYDRSVQTRT